MAKGIDTDQEQPAWLHIHSHEPHPEPPSPDADFALRLLDGSEQRLGPQQLAQLPQTLVHDCLIVSTGHGASGPFDFGGVTLADLVVAYVEPDTPWRYVDVVSADGFGNRVERSELTARLPVEAATHPEPRSAAKPILLALTIDNRPLTRAEGLVRLIVPAEKDDALRQVKWIGRIEIR